ncbi:MAG: hypothetical protein PHX58_05650 [Desulfovibrio sp.]|nr:hypothetical protein [Desulfovibrio sp.]
MARAEPGLADQVLAAAVPFCLRLKTHTSGFFWGGHARWHGVRSLWVTGAAVFGFALLSLRQKRYGPEAALDGLNVALTGVHGLAAVLLVPGQDPQVPS